MRSASTSADAVANNYIEAHVDAGRVIIVTGSPGAGKTAVARRLGQQPWWPLAIHLHGDDSYAYIREAFDSIAGRLAAGGLRLYASQ